MRDCLEVDAPALRVLADAHDRLGWDNFVEGRICKMYLTVAKDIMTVRTTPERWGRTFVTKLMHMTHRQWLFCNAHVHYTLKDGLTEQQHCRIFERVDELMHTDPSELLSCHQQLLHEDFEALGEGSAGDRRTWIESMESALEAAEHYRSGREIMGLSGEVRRRRRVATPCRSPGGSFVYRLTSRG